MKKLFEKLFNKKQDNEPEIIVCGDSWVFGSEIVDPELVKRQPQDWHVTRYDHWPENDAYRSERVFTRYLHDLTGFRVTNLGWPADDNGLILKRAMNYVTQHYLIPGKSTENLFLIVGWSSPERAHFWYHDTDFTGIWRLWPNDKNFHCSAQEKIWRLYVEHINYPEHYIPNFVMNCHQLQNFCVANRINWMCFNSFYQTSGKNIQDWQDVDINWETALLARRVGSYDYLRTGDTVRTQEFLNYKKLWELIDPDRYYCKKQEANSFKNFIQSQSYAHQDVFSGWHPSPLGHELWARELYRYIKQNNLWDRIK